MLLFVAFIFLLITSARAGDDTVKLMRCRDNERQALLHFKNEIVDEFGFLSSWGSHEEDEDCCKWRGIRCSNRTGHVILLDLHAPYDSATDNLIESLSQNYVSLSGKVSPSLLELNHLKYLDLGYNSFDSIPEFIGSLSKLQHLNLSDSYFGGRVPHQLGNLTNLRYLHLGSNDLTGSIPHQLGNLTNLRFLDLGRNYNLTVENLEWLSDLHLLRHLDLSSIDLEMVDLLQSIDSLSFLSTLHLSKCNLPGIISPSLHLTNFSSIPLSIIDLSYNHFTNSSSYNWLFNFSSSLVEIGMSFNPLGGSIPDAFGNMMSLETLNLGNCDLEGEVPKSFINLSHLRSLELFSNNLTGQLPKLLQTLFASKDSLEILDLAQNKVNGSLPDFTSFSSLRGLRLNHNKLSGSFPKRFGQSSPLEYLYLSFNKIQGKLPESIGELSNLKVLDLSFNYLTLEFSSDWTPRFQLDHIILGNCTLGPHFPEWLQSQNNFLRLDICSARISDTIPHWFWDLSPRVQDLRISDNQINGMLPDLSLKFFKLDQIDLSSNHFKGPIPLFPRNISFLNLSKNMFSGSIISLCTIATDFLLFLDLSDNLLSGEVPDCWIDANNLEILDLANNNFSWKIPASFGSLNHLHLLNLHNNSLIGELPSSLKNCSSLKVIDMSEHKLSGKLPAWIGTHLTLLVVLSFRKNEFQGIIPHSACLLNHTQVFDLSQNKISGNIPRCFNKIYSLIQTESLSTTVFIPLSRSYYTYMGFMPSALVQWKGKVSEYKSTLGLLKCIDLSSNKLIGQIPHELASLDGLISLNLSRNSLTGPAIQKIGQMKMLEVLDLSRNQLSGVIPIGLGNLHFLNFLDLSSNNFSGKIPRSTQLDTFNASAYAGNDKLCGFPLSLCLEDESTSFPRPNDHGIAEDTFITKGFYVSVVLGFAIGFWGFIGPLVLRSSWRYTYFKFLDRIQDWIYTTIAVNMARGRRKFRG